MHYMAILVPYLASTADLYGWLLRCTVVHEGESWMMFPFTDLQLARGVAEEHPPDGRTRRTGNFRIRGAVAPERHDALKLWQRRRGKHD